MKCKICNRYIEHKEFENSGICSAICYGISEERERIIKKTDEISTELFKAESKDFKMGVDKFQSKLMAYLNTEAKQ